MLNVIPVIGWLLSLVVYSCLSVPFWVCWTYAGLGEKYFTFLPYEWHSIPFWDCVGLCFCFVIAKMVVLPQFSSSSTNNKQG